MIAETLLHASHARALDRLAELPPELALRRALPLVARLVRAFPEPVIASMLAASRATEDNGPQVVRAVQGRAEAWWLGFFLWLPGASTPIHDHTSWGTYYCAAGTLLEERYRRLDDGAQPDHARLRLAWRRRWGRGESSELLPYEGGIHRVTNPGDRPALSVHLYGPRQSAIDGRDYDPTHDFVCDRAA